MTFGPVRAPVVVRAPATSANLGPGFDALGLALDLYDEASVSVSSNGPTAVEVRGEGAGDVPRDEDHLIVRAARAAFDRIGARQPYGLRLTCANRIPHGRGLGSSSAAICAGILAARELADGHGLDALALATDLEGHPDNVAACLAGGLTIAWDGPRSVRLTPHPSVRPIALIPSERLPTQKARGLLPDTVPHADAALNAGRAALLVAALTTDPSLLLDATEDRIHQEYRASAMPESVRLVRKLRASGIPAVISGAGPTILVLSDGSSLPELGKHWHIQPLSVAGRGAFVWGSEPADEGHEIPSTVRE